MKVSIIIRSKNEEKWIGLCLSMLFRQTYKNFEVILVDNDSSDKTIQKAKQWPVKLIKIKKFLPGDAINKGIEASNGEIIVCLSAHCIPKDKHWLSSLIKPLNNKKVAGVYGKQVPLSSSSAMNKRDLYIVFGNEKRIQKKDTFFHNANSAFMRSTWKKFPFNPELTNIEDRIWGQEVINAGFNIVYEPKSCVYHHHGIHQDANEDRARKIVKIMENDFFKSDKLSLVKQSTNDIVIIYDSHKYDNFRLSLLQKCISLINSSNQFAKIIFSGTDKTALSFSKDMGLILHKRKDSKNSSIKFAIKDALFQFEKENFVPDSVTITSVDYALRGAKAFEELVDGFYNSAMRPTAFGYLEKRPMISIGKSQKIMNEDLTPRKSIDTGTYICPIGMGYIDLPENFRSMNYLSGQIHLIEKDDPFEFLEIDNSSKIDAIRSLKNYE
jgi:rhamnosyltransferase